MEVWKIIFLSKWVICRFHVNLPGCAPKLFTFHHVSLWGNFPGIFEDVSFPSSFLRDFVGVCPTSRWRRSLRGGLVPLSRCHGGPTTGRRTAGTCITYSHHPWKGRNINLNQTSQKFVFLAVNLQGCLVLTVPPSPSFFFFLFVTFLKERCFCIFYIGWYAFMYLYL